MAIVVNVNGESINYPQIGDTGWADEATDFAVQTSSAFAKLGLDTGVNVDIPSTLDVTGATNLDSTLNVLGNTTLVNLDCSGTLDVTGQSTLQNVDINGTFNVSNFSTTDISAKDSTGITLKNNSGGAIGTFGSSGGTGSSLDGTLGVTGNTTLSGTLGVSGASTLSSTLAVTGNTTLSASLLNSDGTVSTPSISFSGDNDTGLYRIGSNNLGISVGGAKVSEFNSNGFLGLDNYLQFSEKQASGTEGGTFTSGAWRTRVLNTSDVNRITGASLASNQITLPAGTYKFRSVSQAYNVDRNVARLYNITDSSVALPGVGNFANSSSNGYSNAVVIGSFTIASQKVFELQHRCQTTGTTTGFGTQMGTTLGGVANEVYSIVEIWKIA